MQVVISKTSQDGQHTIELCIVKSLRHYAITAAINGKSEGIGHRFVATNDRGIVAAVGRVGILAAEMELLTAAIVAAEANDPECAADNLRRERESIVREINSLLAESRDVISDADEREDGVGAAYRQSAALEREAEAVRDQLAAFDAAHPEITAAIETERRESVARHMWD